ncbi:MAG: alpha/beta hydrolase [Actinomycetota bacterium]|nr:alpha/beta hydrolase [Actinomycetota bacterium]
MTRDSLDDSLHDSLHYNEWGEGDPLIALHPLALESTAFAGVATHLEEIGLRTLGVDLPGFGCTRMPDEPLTPAVLAAPVIELARSLERPPIVMGMSLGGRVALEVALTAPDAVRGLVLVAPYMPLHRMSWIIRTAGSYLDPAWGEKLPLERIWPLLKRTTDLLESIPKLEHDWFARACVRVAYYSTCPDTRTAFLSASRELSLDPMTGPESVWSKLDEIEVPTSFLWAGRDHLIPRSHSEDVLDAMPKASQMEVPCSGHFVNFRHFECMEHAIALATSRVLDEEMGVSHLPGRILTPCLTGRGAEDEPLRTDGHHVAVDLEELREAGTS